MRICAPKVVRCGLLVFAVLWFGQAVQAKVVVPLKGETETRDFRHIQLDNGLQVLLIEDHGAQRAVAAVSVRAGAYQDSADWPGLAHLLQNSLLMADDTDETQGLTPWLQRHGGAMASHISGEYAHYQFDINADGLAPALRLLARQLISPQLSAETVERSAQRAHIDYKSAEQAHEQRVQAVYRELFSPRHPAAQVAFGNWEGLPDTELRALLKALQNFHRRWYLAERAALVISGPQPLDALQAMAEESFAAWQRGENPAFRQPNWFSDDFLPAQVNIQSQGEQRHLSLLFPVAGERQHYTRKPLNYIAHMLTREEEGSLLALLRDLGWVETLQVGALMEVGQEALFEIRVQLTPLGVRAAEQIVALLFYQIGQLERTTLHDWRYLELQQMAALAFRFKPRSEAADAVAALAVRLHHYRPEDILSGDYLYDQFDAGLIRRTLRRMRPNNVLISLVAPSVEGEQVTGHYQVPYQLHALEPRQPEIKGHIKKRLFPPKPNPFIPQRVQIKEPPLLPSPGVTPSAGERRPQLIFNQPRTRVWFQQDRQFQAPEASLNLRLTLPLVAAGQTGAARAELFAALVQDQLRQLEYPAALAGLEFTVTAHSRGLDVNVYGYASRQSLLLSHIVRTIQAGRFEADRFEPVQAELLRRWQEKQATGLQGELVRQIPRLHLSPYWTSDDLLQALADETLESMHRFTDAMLQNAQITGLFYGNLYRQEAVRLAAMVEHQLRADPSRRELAAGHIYQVPETGGPYVYRHSVPSDERLAILYVQALGTDSRDAAHMHLLRRTAASEFTHRSSGFSLDERRELVSMPLRNLDGILFVVHSANAECADLMASFQAFMASYDEALGDEFATHQAAVVRELRSPADNLRQQAQRYWQSLLLGNVQFNHRRDLAAAVEQVSVESLRRYFEAAVNNPERQVWIASDGLGLPGHFRSIDSIDAYREGLQSLTFP